MKMILRLACLCGIAILLCQASAVQAQDFGIGSKAPAIDIEHWMSTANGHFDKVTDFEDGNVYILEFWATWCGPCIASMPHLVEVQEKYADKGVQIISVSDEDLETVEKFLERDVRGDDDKTYAQLTSAYCLTADPDESTHDDFFRAAGQTGIPCAFIIGKTGHVEWIGHPMTMDDPLEQVINDQWDREAYKEKLEAEQKAQKKLMAISRLLQQEKFEEALEALDEVIEATEDEAMKQQLQNARPRIMMMAGGDLALQGIKQAAKNLKTAEEMNAIAWGVYEMAEADEEKVSDELIAEAVRIAEKAVELKPDDGAILDTLAHLVYLQGDLDQAIEIQTKAVENGGELKEQLQDFLDQLLREKKDQ